MPPDGDGIDAVVEEFLEGRPRAEELAELRAALESRLHGLETELARARDDAERESITRELETLRRQVEALAREEMITEFVEASVRATATWSLLHPEEPEE